MPRRLTDPPIPGALSSALNTAREPFHNFNVTLTTPMLGGGVAAQHIDTAMPIRASAIRAQLRFWWRLLQTAQATDDAQNSEAIFTRERDLWGAMAERQQDHSGKVRLRVIQPVKSRLQNYCDDGDKQLNQRLNDRPKTSPVCKEFPAYALFPAKADASYNKTDGKLELTKRSAQLLMPGATFTLSIQYTGSDTNTGLPEEVLQALRYWASFGGLGSRTRRGLGSVDIEGLDTVSVEEADKFGLRLVLRQKNHPTAVAAWNESVERLQQFRQGENLGRKPPWKHHGNSRNKTPGTSNWPEPMAIRAITGQYLRVPTNDDEPHISRAPAATKKHFPRAYFGLPVIFQMLNDVPDGIPENSKKKNYLKPNATLIPAGKNRMASPVILTTLRQENGNYKAAALLLPYRHINEMDLTISPVGNQSQNLPSGSWWPKDRSQRDAAAAGIKPLKQYGSDPLAAFMNYFGEAST